MHLDGCFVLSLIRLALLWSLTATGVSPLQGALLELPTKPPDQVQLIRLSRTLNLLRSATPENRRPVRIIFFGQSITQQAWWVDVSRRLREAYPNAELDIRNHAIIGFNADRLAGMVEHHVALYRPDLVILHDYGLHPDMERLVARIRNRTAADILLQTDHLLVGDDAEVTDPALLHEGLYWPYRNYVLLPRLAAQYDACLGDMRDRWRDYLRQTGKVPKQLLSDHIHVNDEGNLLMAKLIWRYLKPDVDIPLGDPDSSPRARAVGTSHGEFWRSDRLLVAFSGSEVEVVTDADAPEVSVLLDGKPPGECPDLYAFSAVTRAHSSHEWPALLEVESGVPPLVESWKMTVTEVFSSSLGFRFQVDGSLTGHDGEGRSDEDFRSNSGRILLRTEVHMLPFAARLKGQPIPLGFTARWSGLFQGTNSFRPSPPVYLGHQPTTLLFRGLPDGQHTLELRQQAQTRDGFKLIRVYSPSGQAGIELRLPPVSPQIQLRLEDHSEAVTLKWPTNYPFLRPQRSTGLGKAGSWTAIPGVPTTKAGEFSMQIGSTNRHELFRLHEIVPH